VNTPKKLCQPDEFTTENNPAKSEGKATTTKKYSACACYQKLKAIMNHYHQASEKKNSHQLCAVRFLVLSSYRYEIICVCANKFTFNEKRKPK
jgi:hypothetical protein